MMEKGTVGMGICMAMEKGVAVVMSFLIGDIFRLCGVGNLLLK